MAFYRLSCACGEAIPVAVGQAGGEIDCPGCGTRLHIPKLRRLRELESWDFSPKSAADGPPAAPAGGGNRPDRAVGPRYEHPVSGRPWGTAEAVLAAGSLVAAASLLVAAWLVRPASTGIEEALLRDAVGRAPVADIYRAWRSISASGVDRGATPEEASVQRIVKNRATLAVAVGLLGSIGGLAAIGAAVAIVARRRFGGQPGLASRAGRKLLERSGP